VKTPIFTWTHVLTAWWWGVGIVLGQGIVAMFLPIPPIWWIVPYSHSLSIWPGVILYGVVFGAIAFVILACTRWRNLE